MKKIVLFALGAALMLLAGCGKKECYFVTQEGKGIKEGSPVVWNEAIVGRVSKLEAVDDGTRLTIKFAKKYNDLIHDGVAGRVVVDEKSSPPKAGVLLTGGKDPNQPILEDGDQIPESKVDGVTKEGFAAFFEWLKTSRALELQIVCTILLIILVLLKFVSKRFKFVLFLGFLAAIGYVCVTFHIGWSNHKERLLNVKETAKEAKEWILQHGEKLHTILETAIEADD